MKEPWTTRSWLLVDATKTRPDLFTWGPSIATCDIYFVICLRALHCKLEEILQENRKEGLAVGYFQGVNFECISGLSVFGNLMVPSHAGSARLEMRIYYLWEREMNICEIMRQ